MRAKLFVTNYLNSNVYFYRVMSAVNYKLLLVAGYSEIVGGPS
jgi:hypothetical protein